MSDIRVGDELDIRVRVQEVGALDSFLIEGPDGGEFLIDKGSILKHYPKTLGVGDIALYCALEVEIIAVYDDRAWVFERKHPASTFLVRREDLKRK